MKRYGLYDPIEGGISFFDTKELALREAEISIMAGHPAGEGWVENMFDMCVFEVLFSAIESEKQEAPEGSEFSYLCTFKMEKLSA